jgi:hypothetical protein
MTINLDELERLAKAITNGAAAQKSADPVIRNMGRLEFDDARKQYLRAANPTAILELVAEVRRLREDLQSTKLLAHANAEMFKAERVDGERYRWLRQQHWNESTLFVVVGHHSVVRIGTYCPSDDLLDAAIDEARAKDQS